MEGANNNIENQHPRLEIETKKVPAKASPYSFRTDIDAKYGEKTWRPVQSVIDLVQNHMDATTVYEMKLLNAIGIKEYRSEEAIQQIYLSYLNDIKYRKKPDEIESSYSCLANFKSSLGENFPSKEVLIENLKEIKYDLPRMRLAMKKGDEFRLVDYDKVKDLPLDWQIEGFRVDDTGTGFDKELLGMMGASLKKESAGKRGGLGEGLKMSVLHLTREGASVRLFSRNGDQLWTAMPNDQDGRLGFGGRAKEESMPHPTGSLTYVNFSKLKDEAMKKEISDSLDPRIGEGLGKYILEYRGSEFESIANTNKEITSEKMNGGRVYVKGLLVEENNSLLWSYNLQDKFAIGGRDRKNVNRDILEQNIAAIIGSLNDRQKISELVSAVAGNTGYLELKVLGEVFPAADREKLWKECIEEKFGYTPGKDLFAPSNLPSDQERLAKERGWRIISLMPLHMGAVKFFQRIYGRDVVMSFEEFAKVRDYDIKDIKLKPEIFDIVSGFRDEGVKVLENAWMNYEFRDRGRNVKFIPADKETSFESGSPFEYKAQGNIIRVKEDRVKPDFSTLADMCVQLLKASTGKDTFDVESQSIADEMAEKAIADIKPDLMTNLNIAPYDIAPELGKYVAYSQEKKETDNILYSIYNNLDTLNKLDITKEEVKQVLTEIKTQIQGNPDSKKAYIHRAYCNFSEKDFAYHYNGEVYIFDKRDPQLKVVGNITPEEIPDESSNPNESSFKLNHDMWSLIPFQLQDGESVRLSFKEGYEGQQVIIKRKGNKIIAQKIIHSKFEPMYTNTDNSLVNNNGERRYIKNYNNVLSIFPEDTDEVITLRKDDKPAKEEAWEVNRGKEFIQSNITTDYGSQVWQDPKRILLDALQNHIDAQKDKMPDIVYSISGSDNQIKKVSKEELQNLDQSWKIIGIDISDQGDGFTTPYLSSLGKSSKGDGDVGKFGEGLKMLCASALRQRINMRIASRDWTAEPAVYERTVKNYEAGKESKFNMLGFKMQWLDEPRKGSYTNFSVSEVMDKNQSEKSWGKWIDVLDPRNIDGLGQRGLERYFLSKEDKELSAHSDGIVSLLIDMPGNVYEKGLPIPRNPSENSEPYLFGYNIDENIISARERNEFDQKVFDSFVSDYYKNLTDTQVMTRILEEAKKNPKVDYFEYKMINSASPKSRILWRQTYHKVFGDDAVLSLRTIMPMGSQWDNKVVRAIVNEVHLENANLQILPRDMTNFFEKEVYTSREYMKEYEGKEIELSPQDKDKLVGRIREINQVLLTILESIESNPERKEFLDKIISGKELDTRKEHLRDIAPEKIRIKNRLYPSLGSIKEVDNRPVVTLNEEILSRSSTPTKFLKTYVHEASHYLSGKRDYVIGFQRFLMMLALSGRIKPISS